jgi:hypothetical protein
MHLGKPMPAVFTVLLSYIETLRTCRIIFQSLFEVVCEKMEIPVIKRQALNRQN